MRTVKLTFGVRARRWLKLLGLGLVVLVLVEPGDSPWARFIVAPIARAQGNDAVYEEEVQKGTELLRRRKYEDALKSFKRANEIRDKKSADCFYGVAQAADVRRTLVSHLHSYRPRRDRAVQQRRNELGQGNQPGGCDPQTTEDVSERGTAQLSPAPRNSGNRTQY